jgi:alpha-tubulin suppressor-like RCC1 family protein
MTLRFRGGINKPGYNPAASSSDPSILGPVSGRYLYTWGSQSSGQSGLNSSSAGYKNSSPVQVGTLTNWLIVSAASSQASTIKSDGTLWSWGSGQFGTLGVNTGAAVSSPTQVGLLTNWSQVNHGGRHVLAVKKDGTLWAWGSNDFGEVGLNIVATYPDRRSSPAQVGLLTNWLFVAAGPYISFGIKTDSTLWAWGNDAQGGLGNNSGLGSRSSPTQVGVATNWSQIAIGSNQGVMAIKSNGTLWGWGYNSYGQLGFNNTVSPAMTPVQVGTDTNWLHLCKGSGSMHFAAIKTDGTLWIWGKNVNGELGQNDVVYRSSPTQVGILTNWGYGGSSSPIQTGGKWVTINYPQAYSRLSVTYENTMAIKNDGTLWAWGKASTFSIIGDSTNIDRSSPVQVTKFSSANTFWQSIDIGSTFSIGLIA